jgi:hypothetical protein
MVHAAHGAEPQRPGGAPLLSPEVRAATLWSLLLGAAAAGRNSRSTTVVLTEQGPIAAAAATLAGHHSPAAPQRCRRRCRLHDAARSAQGANGGCCPAGRACKMTKLTAENAAPAWRCQRPVGWRNQVFHRYDYEFD